MVLAYQAGISVFATGGIGGVHRGAEKSEYCYFITFWIRVLKWDFVILGHLTEPWKTNYFFYYKEFMWGGICFII